MSAYINLVDKIKAASAVADPESYWGTGTNFEEYNNSEKLPVIFMLPVLANSDNVPAGNKVINTFTVTLLIAARDTPDFNTANSDLILDGRFSVANRLQKILLENIQSLNFSLTPFYRDQSAAITGWVLTFDIQENDVENICV